MNPYDQTILEKAESQEDLFYPTKRPVRDSPPPGAVDFAVLPDHERQTILGMGFEIQSDSIASGNAGLPEHTTSVPHDLAPLERERLAREMLSGFRYCRIAGGLYWRGLTEDRRQLAPRWPEQLRELRELLKQAGVEGASLEYWSPPPYWKANRRYEGAPPDETADPENRLRWYGGSFADDPEYRGDRERFLGEFADACSTDVHTLRAAGIPVVMWALNNEPNVNTPYSSCFYEPDEWAETFAAVAPVIRRDHPQTAIIGDCADYTGRYLARLQELYPDAARFLDYHVLHTIGFTSQSVAPIAEAVRRKLRMERPIFQNEYEYLHGPATPDRCMNTVNNILNWFQLAGAPAWFWIHALKPVTNAEASGYSLGFWMPADGLSPDELRELPQELSQLRAGTWTWNPYNWHAVAGFLRHVPWDSVVLAVDESVSDADARVLALRRPDGQHVVVVSNHTTSELDVRIRTGRPQSRWAGYRFTPEEAGPEFTGTRLGLKDCIRLTGDDQGSGAPRAPGAHGDRRAADVIRSRLSDRSWEFWVEQ